MTNNPIAPPIDDVQLDIDISIEAGDWQDEPQLRALCLGAFRSAMTHLRSQFADDYCEISLLFSNDEAIADINHQWRNINKPTNVLSFPAFDITPGAKLPPMLGDIAFAYETILAEAALDKKPFNHHLSHLVVHGFLHLLGYDHENDKDAEEMEGLERQILASLQIDDPYGSN